MELERYSKLLNYEPLTGKIYVKKSKRLLVADDTGAVTFVDPDTKERVKIRLDKLAYILANNKLPPPKWKIHHKNLDVSDNRIYNLMCLSPDQSRLVNEARKNLSGGIKISLHPTDMFSYKLSWFEGGKERSKVIEDIVVVKRLERELILKYSKILTVYCFGLE